MRRAFFVSRYGERIVTYPGLAKVFLQHMTCVKAKWLEEGEGNDKQWWFLMTRGVAPWTVQYSKGVDLKHTTSFQHTSTFPTDIHVCLYTVICIYQHFSHSRPTAVLIYTYQLPKGQQHDDTSVEKIVFVGPWLHCLRQLVACWRHTHERVTSENIKSFQGQYKQRQVLSMFQSAICQLFYWKGWRLNHHHWHYVENMGKDMGVSKNRGAPKSSIWIGFCIINHPFWGTPYFWKHPYKYKWLT